MRRETPKFSGHAVMRVILVHARMLHPKIHSTLESHCSLE